MIKITSNEYLVSQYLSFFLAVYGNRFDSEDLSHERAFPSKPTRKPQKKQKTSPAPSDATVMQKEHTVTSFNQVREKTDSVSINCLLLILCVYLDIA